MKTFDNSTYLNSVYFINKFSMYNDESTTASDSTEPIDEFKSVRHLIGKHVKIIAEDHPWRGEVGHITDWCRDFTGKPYCEITLDNQCSHRCAVYNGKDLKYI